MGGSKKDKGKEKRSKKDKGKKTKKLVVADPNSLSSSDTVRQKHLAFDLDLDFEHKRFSGSVTITFKALSSATSLLLDTKTLLIAAVEDGKGTLLPFRLRPEEQPYGRALEIHLDEKVCKGDKFTLKIEYETSPEAVGLQWLAPELTEGKKHPYVFSQFQAIHARSFVPCQDTPSAKVTYEAVIRAPSHLTTLMSAIGLGKRVQKGGVTEFYFSQKVSWINRFRSISLTPSHLIMYIVCLLGGHCHVSHCHCLRKSARTSRRTHQHSVVRAGAAGCSSLRVC